MDYSTVIFATTFLLTWLAYFPEEIATECIFPEFLQSPLDGFGQPLAWQTKVWWLNLRHEPKQRQKQEIFVYRSHMWSQFQDNKLRCDKNPGKRHVQSRATSSVYGNCSEKYLLYNRTCESEERTNRFRVSQYGADGRSLTYLCMTFIKRSNNVIQIMESTPVAGNFPNLCQDSGLKLQPWPWIATWRREIEPCPISGGYSFRTINRLTNEKFCEDEWRRSRLEIDCSQGDGLNFISPKGSADCNPFSSEKEVTKMVCWAGWEENSFTFLVVGEVGQEEPQYCLRFPRNVRGSFEAIVYYSVFCLDDTEGMPMPGMEYHGFEMVALDSEVCVDDDTDHCVRIMRQGHCSKGEKYAIHCELTCGKCDERQEFMSNVCAFPSNIVGRWIYADIGGFTEKVKINHTTISLSTFGHFHCKEKSVISSKLFKTVNIYNNGCAMRYTCFEFDKLNHYVMQFRVSTSYRGDVSLDHMCQFKHQDKSVGDRFRSDQKRILISDGRIWDQSCGFNNSIPFNGTIYGEPCHGMLSDWDEDGCVTRGRFSLSSDTCKGLHRPMEFQCLAFIEDHPMEQFLLTKSLDSMEYNCWILTSFPCQEWTDGWQHRAFYKLQGAQCMSSESRCVMDSTPEALLFLHDEEKAKFCKGRNDRRTTTQNFFFSPPTQGSKRDYLPYNDGKVYPSATVYPLDGNGKPETFAGSAFSSSPRDENVVQNVALCITLTFISFSLCLPT